MMLKGWRGSSYISAVQEHCGQESKLQQNRNLRMEAKVERYLNGWPQDQEDTEPLPVLVYRRHLEKKE